ncbi:MAG: hypothetical protein PHS54_07325, partial [Clostridia bacterium]|nr:hypothetical protein [Clostridia bacterium]
FGVELTHDPHRIAAESTWTEISNDLQRSTVTVSVIPSEVQNQVIDKITAVIKEVSAGDGYEPGEGQLIQSTIDKAKWVYVPFAELKTGKHPSMFRTIYIAGKFKEVEYATDQFLVVSIFTYFGSIALPDSQDRERAWRYARWKYDIDTSALGPISYDKNLPYPGETSGFADDCKLGPGAFSSENFCASVLGHENVHGIQGWENRLYSGLDWLAGKVHWTEVEAYNWQINTSDQIGLSQNELNDIIAWRNYYNRQGPKPE